MPVKGRRLGQNFVALSREAFTEMAKTMKPGPGWLFLRLMVEADHKTGTLRGTYRQLADAFGCRVGTLRDQLAVLKDMEEITIVGKARNQHEEMVIAIVRYFELQGRTEPPGWCPPGVTETETATPSAVTVGVTVGVPEGVTATPLPPAASRTRSQEVQEEREEDKIAPPARSSLSKRKKRTPKTPEEQAAETQQKRERADQLVAKKSDPLETAVETVKRVFPGTVEIEDTDPSDRDAPPRPPTALAAGEQEAESGA